MANNAPFRAQGLPLSRPRMIRPQTNSLQLPTHLPTRQRAPTGPSSIAGTPQSSGTPRPSTPQASPRPSTPQASGRIQSGEYQQVMDTCHRILDEIRQGRQEQRKIGEDVRKFGQMLGKLQEDYKRLNDQLKEQAESAFAIEKSTYKDGLIREIGMLFVKSLKRQPCREDVGRAIMKVLGDEGRVRQKFNKAKSYCYNRLTDLRCEERRRIFGNKPCDTYPKLTTSEFVDRFMSTIKASIDQRNIYAKHLALLRKFTREQEARNDTYKKFRVWLDNTFAMGSPTDEQWENIIKEDEEYPYHQHPDNNLQYDDNIEYNQEYTIECENTEYES